MELVVNIAVGVIIAATPLILAAIGELVTERAGVLNLGVEGMMIIGALVGFAVTFLTGNPWVGMIAAILAGIALSMIFAVLTQTLLANQIASGLALTIFGLGLTALIGQGYTGKSIAPVPQLDIPLLSDLPIVGKLIFSHDPIVYVSIALVVAVKWYLNQTRSGLILRAVGENHEAAHAIGHSVLAYRYGAIAFGGACAGLAGAYLSVVQTQIWVEAMTAGRGWIALALVVFAAWQPYRALLGAYLFGGITIIQLHGQALGLEVEPQLLAMLPYLATILVLVLISQNRLRANTSAPGSLGKTFYASS
ncbi:MAG: ABC transporter permease [Pseudomonadota bacterium]